jgi:hypothetical protein
MRGIAMSKFRLRQQKLFGVILLAACPAVWADPVIYTVTFDATANALTGAERAAVTSHFLAAGNQWAQQLEITGQRNIEVQIGIDDTRPTANGGSVTSNFVAVVLARNMFEQGMAAELRTGVDPNGATPDVQVNFNTSYLRNELWFDPDPVARTAVIPTGKTDAMSVVLHELGHALTYNGFADLNTGQPPTTFWSTFDRWMSPGTPTFFDGPKALIAAGLRPDLTIGNLFHWSNSAPMANAINATIRAYASPSVWTFVNGAPKPLMNFVEPISVDADSTRTPNQINVNLLLELMNGVVFYRGTRYQISALDRAVLFDTGLPTKLFASGFEF